MAKEWLVPSLTPTLEIASPQAAWPLSDLTTTTTNTTALLCLPVPGHTHLPVSQLPTFLPQLHQQVEVNLQPSPRPSLDAITLIFTTGSPCPQCLPAVLLLQPPMDSVALSVLMATPWLELPPLTAQCPPL